MAPRRSQARGGTPVPLLSWRRPSVSRVWGHMIWAPRPPPLPPPVGWVRLFPSLGPRLPHLSPGGGGKNPASSSGEEKGQWPVPAVRAREPHSVWSGGRRSPPSASLPGGRWHSAAPQCTQVLSGAQARLREGHFGNSGCPRTGVRGAGCWRQAQGRPGRPSPATCRRRGLAPTAWVPAGSSCGSVTCPHQRGGTS